MEHQRFIHPFCRRVAALLPLLIALHTLGQDSTAQKKRWLAFSFTAEYRIAPIYPNQTSVFTNSLPGLYYSQDEQLVGPALGFDLRKNVFRHWVEVGFGVRLRYDHLLYEGAPSAGLNKSVKTLYSDYMFGIFGRIPVGKEREVRVSVGIGYMNRGSNFMVSEVDSLGNGQYITWSTSGSFRYTADLGSISYNVRGLEIGVAVYHAAESNYRNPSFIILSPFLKYDIWR